jgi:hypothetical protein
MSKLNTNTNFKKNQQFISFYLGVPLWVGLSVPAFFCSEKKSEQKKSSTAIPHARNRFQLQKLKT